MILDALTSEHHEGHHAKKSPPRHLQTRKCGSDHAHGSGLPLTDGASRRELQRRLSRKKKRNDQADDHEDQAEHGGTRLAGPTCGAGASNREHYADNNVDQGEECEERISSASDKKADSEQLEMLIIANRLFLLFSHLGVATIPLKARPAIVDHQRDEVKRSRPRPGSRYSAEATSSRFGTVHEACPERRRTKIGEAIGGCPPSATIRSGNEALRIPSAYPARTMRLITPSHSRIAARSSFVTNLGPFVTRFRVHCDVVRSFEPLPIRPFRPEPSCKLSTYPSFRVH